MGQQEGWTGALLPDQLQEGKGGNQERRHHRSASVNTGNPLRKHTHCTCSTVSQPRWADRARSALLERVPQPCKGSRGHL